MPYWEALHFKERASRTLKSNTYLRKLNILQLPKLLDLFTFSSPLLQILREELSAQHCQQLFQPQSCQASHTMPTTTTILTGLAGVVAILALAVYLFGIPPEVKRKMEKAALKSMGENKASYLMKGLFHLFPFPEIYYWAFANTFPDQISKIPESDQQDVKDLKKGISNAVGGGLQNPLGEQGGELADKITSPFTGR
jgi:hypothetical protein